ncbi:hypothetical protein [Pelagicoccus mobilis]|uniref:Uncharacterized protein n=1 Tax=Pelagicoccus mobilis TaxID=415221 RepID=A0A934VST3_9BACT|nr:hypothetical protein [Pelagicoccus mobilis]MBK1878824.1 hypothetical protein [Pelagicoccus mobilis]
MKKLKILPILFLAITPLLETFAQNIVMITRRHVPADHMQDYANRESTYWKAVAEKHITDGSLTAWSVWRKVGGFDLNKGHNFVVVSVFTPEQFAMTHSYRKTLKSLFPDASESEMRVNKISTVKDNLMYRNLSHFHSGDAQAVRVNYSKAKSRDYYRVEPEIWGPFIDEQMKAGTTKVVSWGFYILTNPRGRGMHHDAISVDGFASVTDALLGGNFDEGVEFPENIDEIFDRHEKVESVVYSLVAKAESKD